MLGEADLPLNEMWQLVLWQCPAWEGMPLHHRRYGPLTLAERAFTQLHTQMQPHRAVWAWKWGHMFSSFGLRTLELFGLP